MLRLVACVRPINDHLYQLKQGIDASRRNLRLYRIRRGEHIRLEGESDKDEEDESSEMSWIWLLLKRGRRWRDA